ncbi:MAG: TerC/Alx family metal homeostasis membrane protein [Bryobacterales bacterium]|nr:TerC/Alx family metal homeostasis membrane protein [Bryobacterales bacterium]
MTASTVSLFPFDQYWWFYLAFTAAVLLLLVMDLGLFHRKAHSVSFSEAGTWVFVWVSLALLFCYGLYAYSLHTFANDARLLAIPNFNPAASARQVALEFLTGYVLEESLSVDNMFVFVVVFGFFGIPQQFQHRVLFFGILGALIFRALFIALGSALLQFQWTILIFGAILIITGVKMMFSSDAAIDPEHNKALRLIRRFVPITPTLHGPRFFITENGKHFGTPLLLCLVFLELTDILFAVDSVPAIFGVTREPLIVFTSNIFAILGLRSLFFLLAGAVHLFHLLKYGLSIVLIFVGLKMVWLNKLFDGHFPILLSLGIILGVIAASIGLSLLFPKPPDEPLPESAPGK